MDIIPANSRMPFSALGDRLETPARDAEAEAREREEQARQREEEDTRLNAIGNAWLRARTGRSVVQVPTGEEIAALPEDRQRRVRLELAALNAGVLDAAVDDVEKLLDWDAIERDADQAHAIEKGVGALVAQKPYLTGGARRVQGIDAGERGRASVGTDMNVFLRAAAGIDPRRPGDRSPLGPVFRELMG